METQGQYFFLLTDKIIFHFHKQLILFQKNYYHQRPKVFFFFILLVNILSLGSLLMLYLLACLFHYCVILSLSEYSVVLSIYYSVYGYMDCFQVWNILSNAANCKDNLVYLCVHFPGVQTYKYNPYVINYVHIQLQ